MVTSRDVARVAGVSQTTVSRVLNGNANVSPATRERVLAALENYVPNAQARAMRTNRTRTIGVVATNITNPYFPQLVEALNAAAQRRDLRMLLWSDANASADAAVQGARMGLVDGICFASASGSNEGVRALLGTRIPLVLVNRGVQPLITDQVTSNSEQIGSLVARYLLENGHRDIGIIGGPDDVMVISQRRQAFLLALARSGISVRDEWLHRGPLAYATGHEGAMRLFAEGAPHPSAIFCGNDLIAFGAMGALRQLGIRVPDDVWVVGLDDLPMASWEVFDLTTVRQPVEEMAEHALEMLCRRIEGDTSEPEEVLLDVEFVVRGSTAHAALDQK